MAVYNIPKAEAYYADERQNLYPGIRYGRIYGLNGVWYTYTAYIMFDASVLLRSSVMNVLLKRNRPTPETAGVNYSISTFASDNASVPQPLPNISSINVFPGNIRVSNDTASGTISTDITPIFNMANSVSGYIGTWFDWINPTTGYVTDTDAWLEVTANPLPALGPTGLLPIVPQNPRGNIVFAWQHNPNPGLLAPDPQTASQIEISQDGAIITSPIINGTGNTYTLPANTLTTYTNVSYHVRTQTQYNDWGEWSSHVTFTLTAWPPLQPTLVFPLNLSVNAENGVLLEFVYNSVYDSIPSGFDVRYRIDSDAWINISNTGQLSVLTDPIIGQHDVEWQVMAYGQLGDAGPWSAIGLFFSIGGPPAPAILGVTNSNRPQVAFTTANAVSFEMEFLQEGAVIYKTGNQPLIGMTFRVNEFFANGDYEVRLRIANQYGFNSAWVSYQFTISTVAPQPLTLDIPSSHSLFARLYFDNPTGLTVYIHRAESGRGDFKRIAKTESNTYDDYTAAPYKEYVYFLRAVNPDFSFADSNKAKFYTKFPYTTVARESSKSNMLKLLRQIDDHPTKERSHSIEKTFTDFIGRVNPVIQLGNFTIKSLSYSFFCKPDERDLLEAYSESGEALVFRDKQFGTIFGQIDGAITDIPKLGGTIASFAVRQVDYSEEVPL